MIPINPDSAFNDSIAYFLSLYRQHIDLIISSLLHFLITVIAGSYTGILLCSSINLTVTIYIWIFDLDLLFLLIFYYPLFISIATIIYSSFISLSFCSSSFLPIVGSFQSSAIHSFILSTSSNI